MLTACAVAIWRTTGSVGRSEGCGVSAGGAIVADVAGVGDVTLLGAGSRGADVVGADFVDAFVCAVVGAGVVEADFFAVGRTLGDAGVLPGFVAGTVARVSPGGGDAGGFFGQQ